MFEIEARGGEEWIDSNSRESWEVSDLHLVCGRYIRGTVNKKCVPRDFIESLEPDMLDNWHTVSDGGNKGKPVRLDLEVIMVTEIEVILFPEIDVRFGSNGRIEEGTKGSSTFFYIGTELWKCLHNLIRQNRAAMVFHSFMKRLANREDLCV